MASASSAGKRTLARCARASVGPSTSSMIRARRAARVLDAEDRRDSGVAERCEHPRLALEAGEPLGVAAPAPSGSTLIATSRPSRGSRARYTSPMPPAPERRDDLVGTEPGAGAQQPCGRGYYPTSVACGVESGDTIPV